MPTPQSLKNHKRFHAPFHLFALPILLANVIVTIVQAIRSWPNQPGTHLWRIAVAAAIFTIAGLARGNALRAQDRIIRLEERLRLKEIVSPSEYVELEGSLSMSQYIALRFASNPELPDLARRAVREKLTPRQIKEAIVSWRPDNDRI